MSKNMCLQCNSPIASEYALCSNCGSKFIAINEENISSDVYSEEKEYTDAGRKKFRFVGGYTLRKEDKKIYSGDKKIMMKFLKDLKNSEINVFG